MDVHDIVVLSRRSRIVEIGIPPVARFRETTGRALPNSSTSVAT
jgi:hypothetical protein